MSTTISGVLLQLAAVILPMLGISIGTDELTSAIQTIVVIATGLWIWYERVKKGGVNWFGKRV